MIHNPQVFKSPISNECLKVTIDGQTVKELVPNFPLQVSFRKLHNSMVSPSEENDLKEERYEQSNIIIMYSLLQTIIIP